MTEKLKVMICLVMSKKLSRTSVLAVLMMVFAIPSFAQGLVKGVVIDSSGEPIIGATVVQKEDRKNAAITDIDGNFSLKLPGSKGTIVVSYIGMSCFR